MAITPQKAGASAEDSFIADRAMFWERFTGFTKYAVIAVVVFLIAFYLLFG